MTFLYVLLVLVTGFSFMGAIAVPVFGLMYFTSWVRDDSRKLYNTTIQGMRLNTFQKIFEFILSDIPYIFLAASPRLRRAFVGTVLAELLLCGMCWGGIRLTTWMNRNGRFDPPPSTFTSRPVHLDNHPFSPSAIKEDRK